MRLQSQPAVHLRLHPPHNLLQVLVLQAELRQDLLRLRGVRDTISRVELPQRRAAGRRGLRAPVAPGEETPARGLDDGRLAGG